MSPRRGHWVIGIVSSVTCKKAFCLGGGCRCGCHCIAARALLRPLVVLRLSAVESNSSLQLPVTCCYLSPRPLYFLRIDYDSPGTPELEGERNTGGTRSADVMSVVTELGSVREHSRQACLCPNLRHRSRTYPDNRHQWPTKPPIYARPAPLCLYYRIISCNSSSRAIVTYSDIHLELDLFVSHH